MYEMTSAQKQIASLAAVADPESLVIDATGIVATMTSLSSARVEQILMDVIENNDAFRLNIVADGPHVRQRFHASPPRNIEVLEFSNREEFESWRNDADRRPIPMSGSPWFLSGVIIGGSQVGLRVRMHHMISDAYSVALVMGDFRHRVLDVDNERANVERGSFERCIAEHVAYLNSDRFAQDRDHWISELSTKTVTLPWPASKVEDNHVARESFQLDDELIERLVKFCNEQNTRPSSVLMACCAHLLAGGGRDDWMAVGTTLHGRHSRNERISVGMLVNTVPVLLGISGIASLVDAVDAIDAQRAQAIRRNRFNFTQMRQTIGDQGGAVAGLCDLIVNDMTMRTESGYESEIFWRNSGVQRNPMTISVVDWNGTGRFSLDYDYRTSLFSHGDILHFHGRMVAVLRAVLQDPSAPMRVHPRLSEEDQAALALLNTDRHVGFPTDATVLSLWEEQIRLSGDRVAVIGEANRLTYLQVDRKADDIAHALIGHGVRAGDYVALIGARTPELVCAIIGIVKTGAVYVPVDADYPADRISYILDDCGAAVVVSMVDCDVDLGDYHHLNISDVQVESDHVPVAIHGAPTDDLYVIYTSGTTGKPKGVRVNHKNVVRLLHNQAFPFKFSSNDVWMLFHYYGFDFSVWEMYGALLYGGTLVVPTREQTRDPEALNDLMRTNKVTVLNQVPSSFYALSGFLDRETCSRLRYVIFGGEALDESRIASWVSVNSHVDVVNMYGITETTVHVTYKFVESGGGNGSSKRNVGRPLPTTGVVILDGEVPSGIGEVGEICVYGEGVSNGYLNRDLVTRERFVFIPWLNETVYRSGDLGSLDAQGTIEYFGRMDSQVKINGHRIELGEIDATLRSYQGVVDCAVLGPEGELSGIQAYFVSHGKASVPDVEQYLRERLPRYMLPAHYLDVESIPLTTNGKLDSRALRSWIARPSQVQLDNTETGLERLLIEVYEHVLGVEDIGAEEDFHALGGDSIKSMMIVSRLRDHGYHVKPHEIQSLSTISRVAEACAKIEKQAGRFDIEPFGEVDSTPIVHDFWQLRSDDASHHNQSLLLEFSKDIAMETLANAWAEVVKTHPILRAHCRGASLYVPASYAEESFVLNITDVFAADEARALLSEMNRSFDILQPPLIRATVARTGDRNFLLLAAHHLVIDGVSWRILLRDLSRALQDPEGWCIYSASTSSTPYRGWARSLTEFVSQPEFEVHRQHWSRVHNQLREASNTAETVALNDATLATLALPASRVDEVATFCRASYGMDFGQTLTAIVCIGMAEWIGSNRIVLEVENHGRIDLGLGVEVADTIGWFTTTYPVVLKLSDDLSVSLIECKDRLSASAKYAVGDGLMRMLDVSIERYVADLTFNYLGDIKELAGEHQPFEVVDLMPADVRSPNEQLRSRMVIDGFRHDSVIEFRIALDGRSYHADINSFGPTLEKALTRIADLGTICDGSITTATDVGADELSADAWLALAGAYGEEAMHDGK
jgi:amino acid adenylation domain-containing protein